MTSRPERQPTSSRPPTRYSPDALIHPTISLTGKHQITVGPKAILQLRSHIDSTYTSISIGAGAILAERASIGYLSPPTLSSGSPPAETIVIGDGVLIETNATVEAASVGAYTVVEARAKLGKGALIGANCKICSSVEIAPGEEVGDGTIVWGSGSWSERRAEPSGRGLHAPTLRKGMVEALGEGLRAAWSVK